MVWSSMEDNVKIFTEGNWCLGRGEAEDDGNGESF